MVEPPWLPVPLNAVPVVSVARELVSRVLQGSGHLRTMKCPGRFGDDEVMVKLTVSSAMSSMGPSVGTMGRGGGGVVVFVTADGVLDLVDEARHIAVSCVR